MNDLLSDNFTGNEIYDIVPLETFDPSVEQIFSSELIGSNLVITSLLEANPVTSGNASLSNYESIPQPP